MTRIELIERLRSIQNKCPNVCAQRIGVLLEDIEEDGVLDVQAPDEIRRDMNLATASNITILNTMHKNTKDRMLKAYLAQATQRIEMMSRPKAK